MSDRHPSAMAVDPRIPGLRVGEYVNHNDMIGRRHIADYEAERLGQVVAERCVQKARDMVSIIARRLEGELP